MVNANSDYQSPGGINISNMTIGRHYGREMEYLGRIIVLGVLLHTVNIAVNCWIDASSNIFFFVLKTDLLLRDVRYSKIFLCFIAASSGQMGLAS